MVTVKEHRHHHWSNKEVLMLKLKGMEGAAMDYAVHGHAVAHIPLGQFEIECVVSHRHPDEDALLLHLPNEKISPLPMTPVYVHFEINHNYFDGLHKAVDCLNEYAITKLLPDERFLKQAIAAKPLDGKKRIEIKDFKLDSEYQNNALKKIICSDPRVPFLVIGPFGTGKTHMLTAVAAALLCDRNSHILICTYQHQCADSIYKRLFKMYGNNIMRLVPNQGIARLIREGQEGVRLLSKVTWGDIQSKRVIVTTFLTAMNLRKHDTHHHQLLFSHVLIDEGAQAREPESLGALAVVKEETKIVIVGDHKQVGFIMVNLELSASSSSLYRVVRKWLF